MNAKPRGIELFERIRMIKRCDLVGGSVSLGVGLEVSKASVKPIVSLPLDQDVALSYHLSVCLQAAMLPPMSVMD